MKDTSSPTNTSLEVIETRVDFIVEQMREVREDLRGIKDLLTRDYATREYVDSSISVLESKLGSKITINETENKPWVDFVRLAVTGAVAAVAGAIISLVIRK